MIVLAVKSQVLFPCLDSVARLIEAAQHAMQCRSPHNLGFQTVILPGSPGYALHPSAQVPLVRMDRAHTQGGGPGKMTVWKRENASPRPQTLCKQAVPGRERVQNSGGDQSRCETSVETRLCVNLRPGFPLCRSHEDCGMLSPSLYSSSSSSRPVRTKPAKVQGYPFAPVLCHRPLLR